MAVLDHDGEDGHIISLSSEVTLVSEMAFPNSEKRTRTSGRYGILQQEGRTLLDLLQHRNCAVHEIQ